MVNALRATSEDRHEVNSVEIPVPLVIRRLSDLCTMKSGESITAKHMDPFAKYPCYGGNGLRGYTSRKTHSGHNLLIGRQGALCGNVCYVEGDIFASEHAVVVSPKPSVNIRWLSYLLERMRLNQYSESSAQPGLSVSKLLLLEVLAPQSYEEQQRIATVLSDTDSLISALEKLIEKKRNIKQGVMQELLTGKRRLPGFSGEWRLKRLGDVLKIRHGKSQHEVVDKDGAYPILASGGQIGRARTFLYDKPSVLIGRKGTIDRPQFADRPFWTIDTLFYSELSSDVVPKFMFFLFLTINWRSYNEASGVPSLNAATIEGIERHLPELSEQRAIAKVLSEAEDEIKILEMEAEKYRLLKQALMQTLLTGKIRLTT